MSSPTLREILLNESSRRNTDLVADLVFQKPELLKDLVEIILSNDEKASWKAAWALDTLDEQHPGLVGPYLFSVIHHLRFTKHDGVRRSTLRMLTRTVIPEEVEGELISLCFDWIVELKEAVAIKVFAMDLLYRYSKKEPALKNELIASIELRMQEETPGFQTHGRQLLKKLYKEVG